MSAPHCRLHGCWTNLNVSEQASATWTGSPPAGCGQKWEAKSNIYVCVKHFPSAQILHFSAKQSIYSKILGKSDKIYINYFFLHLIAFIIIGRWGQHWIATVPFILWNRLSQLSFNFSVSFYTYICSFPDILPINIVYL